MKDQSALLLEYESLKVLKQNLIDKHNCDNESHATR